MRHSKSRKHQADARELVYAALAESQDTRWRPWRSRNQKKVDAGWSKVADAGDVTEKASRAATIRRTAEFAEANWHKAHPIRSIAAKLGVKDKELGALREVQARAAAIEDRSREALRRIDAVTIGGGAKLRERFAKELSDRSGIQRDCKSLAAEYELRAQEHPQGSAQRDRDLAKAQEIKELSKQLRRLNKRDVEGLTEAALDARETLRRHARALDRDLSRDDFQQLREPTEARTKERLELAKEAAAELVDELKDQAKEWEAELEREDVGSARRELAGREVVRLRAEAEKIREAVAAHGAGREADGRFVKKAENAAEALHQSRRAYSGTAGRELAWSEMTPREMVQADRKKEAAARGRDAAGELARELEANAREWERVADSSRDPALQEKAGQRAVELRTQRGRVTETAQTGRDDDLLKAISKAKGQIEKSAKELAVVVAPSKSPEKAKPDQSMGRILEIGR